MNKRVYNSTVGKVFRTLGFLLVLVSSVYISTYLVIQNNTLPFVSSILPFAETIEGVIDSLPAFIAEYIGLALVVGLLLLTWAIRKGVVLRVLITVVLLFGYLESAINNSSSLVPLNLVNPTWMVSVLDLVEPFYDQIVALSEYVVPGVMVAAPMFLWALFANKKPGRFSVLMMRLGTISLFLAVLSLVLGQLFLTTLALENWYITVQTALYMVTYLLFVVGGVFGLIGFSRK
ncbi:MAG: hypothetical protein K8Q99_04765 [Acholeplasmataceae bacterium]|nr:hypothetical protein [Acholeplasmataceae bacterium]